MHSLELQATKLLLQAPVSREELFAPKSESSRFHQMRTTTDLQRTAGQEISIDKYR